MTFAFMHAETFSCAGQTLGAIGAQVSMEPSGYTNPIDVTFTWDRIVPDDGGVAHFNFCLSKDGGATFFEVPACNKNTTNLPCEVSRSATGVATLKMTVRLDPTDPVGGLGD